jgi:hypothetical protein
MATECNTQAQHLPFARKKLQGDALRAKGERRLLPAQLQALPHLSFLIPHLHAVGMAEETRGTALL